MITGQTVKNTYQGDGSTREFTITFEFTDSSQVKFKVNGEEVSTNYSLNSVNKVLTYPTVASGLDALTADDTIEIYRDTAITQEIEFNNGGPLNANMIEDGLDKLTMIIQEIKDIVPTTNVVEKDEGTDIDSLITEGEYFIKNATCSSGFPSDFVTTAEIANQPSYAGITAYVKVIPTVTTASFPTVVLTQVCFLYSTQTGSDITTFKSVYVREKTTAEGFSAHWTYKNIGNIRRKVECGITSPGNNIFVPEKFYPNTTYMLGNVFQETVRGLTSLTLTDLPDSPYPIEIYFMTGATFSGIIATQILGWSDSTTLDINSIYKITISNLIGKIEKFSE